MNKTQLLIIGYGNMIFGAVLRPYTDFGLTISTVGAVALFVSIFAKD